MTRGFLGDRAAYAGWDETSNPTTCRGRAPEPPVHPGERRVHKSGINLDGGIVADISRGGSLTWPPPARPASSTSSTPSRASASRSNSCIATAMPTRGPGQLSPQAHGRHGHPIRQCRRDRLERNEHQPADAVAAQQAIRHVDPDLLVRHGPWHRVHRLAVREWRRQRCAEADAKPKPTPKPTTTPKPPGGGSDPVVTTPALRLARKAVAPAVGVPALVTWSLAGSLSGLRRYDLQYKRDGGAFTKASLTSAGARPSG